MRAVPLLVILALLVSTSCGRNGARALSSAEIRHVFEPLQEALGSMTDRAQADRDRWVELAGEVRRLAGMVAGSPSGSNSGSNSDALEAMRKRIDAMESRLAAQSTRHAQEKQLMIRALDASTERLDQLLRALPGKAQGDQGTGDTSTGGNPGDPTPASGDRDPAKGGLLANVDLLETLVIFLAISLLLLVIVVVFFPGRLRSSVPRVEFEARGEQPTPPAEPETLPNGNPSVAPSPGVVMPHPAPRSDGPNVIPVPHELSLHLDDPQALRGLVEILESYLTTEPYILQSPAPRVAFVQGELQLQFFALPTLSRAEHALLDATVRRLRPVGPTSEDAPAA